MNPTKAPLQTFSQLFSLSWKRLLVNKKALLLPALCMLPSMLLDVVGNALDAGNQASEEISFIPKAIAQSATTIGGIDVHMFGMALGIVILVLSIVFIFITYVASIYSLLVIYEKHNTIKQTITQAISLIIPIIKIGLYAFYKSYSWIPLIFLVLLVPLQLFTSAPDVLFVILIAVSLFAVLCLTLYFYPRFIFCVLIHIREQKGVKESVRLSFSRTNGYWGKIVGNSLLFSLCIMLIMLGVFACFAIVAAIIGFGLVMLSEAVSSSLVWIVPLIVLGIPALIALALAGQYMKYWRVCFVYELARTIFLHPIKTAKK